MNMGTEKILKLLPNFLRAILWFDGKKPNKPLSERANLVNAGSWPPGVYRLGFSCFAWVRNPLPYFFRLKVPKGHNPSLMSKNSSTWRHIKERIQAAEMAFFIVLSIAVVHSLVIDLLFPHQGNFAVWDCLRHTGLQVGEEVGHWLFSSLQPFSSFRFPFLFTLQEVTRLEREKESLPHSSI